MEILVIKPSSLGDIFHALPAVGILRRVYPDARISWIISNRFCDIANLFADVDRIIEFKRDEWNKLKNLPDLTRFFFNLRKENFDWIFDFQGLFRSGICTFFANSSEKIGFASAREFSTFFYNDKVSIPDEIQHAVDKNIYLVNAALGTSYDYCTPRFKNSTNDESVALKLLETNGIAETDPIIAVAPASRWASKTWPPSFFIQVITNILSDPQNKVRFWLLGTTDEQHIGDEISVGTGDDRVTNLMGKTELSVMFELLKRSQILLTNDSGPMHIGAALQVPIVSLFGPTDPDKTGPYGQDHRVFRTKVSCAPCFQKSCPLPRQLCFDDAVNADDVSAHIIQRLSSNRTRA